MVNVVVYARDNGVFKRYAAVGLVEEVTAGFKQLGYRVLVVDRHYLRAGLVVGCVERYRQRDRQSFVSESAYARHKSAGGQRYVAQT